jgi:hypothetical protein
MDEFIPITIPGDRGPLDLEKQIEELKRDNLLLAKEVDRLNEYVQVMELENVRRKEKTKK